MVMENQADKIALSEEELDQNIKTSLDVLNKLLSAYPDLQTTLAKALRYILEVTHRNGGMIIIQGPDDTKPLFWILEGVSMDWANQLNTEESMLRMFCCTWIQPGGLVVTAGPYSPVVIFPLPTAMGQQGILLINGEEPSKQEKSFLIPASESLAHSVYLGRNGALLFEISKLLDTLGMIIYGLDPRHSFDEAMHHLVVGLRDNFACEAVSLVMPDNNHNGVLVKKTLATGPDWIYQVITRSEDGLIGECLQTGKSVLTNDPKNDDRFVALVDGVSGVDIRSILCVPIQTEDEIIGVLAFQNKRYGNFTLYDQQLLSTVARSVVNSLVALQTIQQYRVLNAQLEASRWELIRSRNTLRSLFDNLPEAMYIIDRSYRLIAVNRVRAERAVGEPSLLVGKVCYETFYGYTEPCQGCLVADTFYRRKVTNRTERQWEGVIEPMEWEINTYPIVDEMEEVNQVILVEKDVTEKRRLEGSLTQSEKMAAVGELAAGIAHEINNPLTVILANAQLLEKELPPNEDWRELVDLISRAGTRALHAVKGLLNFARKEQFEFVATDVNETIERALDMVRHELVTRGIDLTYEPGDNLPLLRASPNHLQGVWLNLMMNAMDAMDKDEKIIRIVSYQQGNDVCISIIDNGQGIPPEKLKRIFEPFFTTKDRDRGTGLGLSVCHRVIKQHGGLILVDSKEGEGTTFNVVLPVY
jgi:two-component system, NtrC family, sensor kinase